MQLWECFRDPETILPILTCLRTKMNLNVSRISKTETITDIFPENDHIISAGEVAEGGEGWELQMRNYLQ